MVKFIFNENVWLRGIVLEEGVISPWIIPLLILSIAVCAYFLGSLNSAIIIARLIYKEDIRTKGSGNAGMTNVMRNYGWIPAACTLLGDMLKVFLAMIAGTLLYGYNGAYIAGLFCVLGHIAPLIYRFKGGKGVAATAMFVLYVNWLAFVILLLLFLLIVWASKYLSLGSVMGMLILPLVMYRCDTVMHDKPLRLIITFIIAGLVVYMHRGNIKRIMDKTERKFSFKKTVKKTDSVNGCENPETKTGGKRSDTASDEYGSDSENDPEENYSDADTEADGNEMSDEVRRRKEINRRKSTKKKRKY